MKMYLSFLLIISFAFISYAQKSEPAKPEETEDWSKKPRVVSPVFRDFSIPDDALVLLANDISAPNWKQKDGNDLKWKIENGIMTVLPGSGDIISRQSFGDCHLHLEWRSPLVIKGSGQGRGNSGVFLQSRYEIQILDSYENETYYNGQAGALYKQYPPLVNACSKSGEWNSYDIIYRAPRFGEDGQKLESGRVTVIHNGWVLHNNVEILGTTEYIGWPKNNPHGDAPIILQDHGDLVSFRNIWVRPL
ncbi:MAG: DUF1080 domain-containing protein [Saprospiraceae bacterium]|nr:DUF1080 domain-containing protein [Saprospiraceae bacterium]